MNSNSAFDKLIKEINNSSDDIQRDRGTMFEKLIAVYLCYEPTYQNLYRNVWMLKDVPDTLDIPKKDTGVDIVAQQYDDTLTAVQVKLNKGKVKKGEINSFIAELGKDYYQHGMLISTTDFDYNAMSTIHDNSKDISVIGLSDLRNSKIDWNQFNFSRPKNISLKGKKTLYRYQKEALDKAMSYYKNHDRGQLIMAPGTGKTFTSLKIAEAMAKRKKGQFRILYLVPSIQLLTQTLRGWNADTSLSMTSMAITSDQDASRSKSDNEDVKGEYIGYPATTSSKQFLDNWDEINQQASPADLLVTFSTYQSIDVVSKAQNNGFPKFDLIVADEAHRTTGAHELGKDASFFTKVHSNKNVRSDRRLYQTATPKVYGDKARKNAKDRSIVLSSMDDKSKFGDVFYRLGFGQAISYGILTDYKVMTLAVDESAIHHDMQNIMSDSENGLTINDVGRIIGIWNGMMRRNGYKNPVKNSEYSGSPLKRAIAFTSTIDDSKKVSKQFENVVNEYLESSEKQKTHLTMRHADGQMSALEKGETLDWLSDSNKPENEARIVSNARFLTEGVDIPALDAIIFLAPKRSQVDIVQAVGRIMRKSQGKDYGYIILPIVIPTGEKPEKILDNNKDYETVWQVINALRSVDERFEAIVDTINTNKKNKRFPMIGVGKAPRKANDQQNSDDSPSNLSSEPKSEQTELNLHWNEYRAAIYGKIVQRVGNRKYLDNWSKDVASIAQRQMRWIKDKLQNKKDPIYVEFQRFVKSLKYNINESIDENQAVEMLSQHLITKPIFDSLFNQYDFVNSNPVSQAMEKMIKELENVGFMKEQDSLNPLYESVNIMAEGADSPTDKQHIIITLYNKFFKTAFQSTTKKLGITFTPVEVVDFIVHSVDNALKKYLNTSLINKNIHILDPFTGTGTFIVRTLQFFKKQLNNNDITVADIARKYTQDLHANEIVLLSYYIATINIESTYNEIVNNNKYNPFNGMVLTDTFESTEHGNTLDNDMFGDNNKRLRRQQIKPINVIISNPPYSKGNDNANDGEGNVSYPELESRIRNTYVRSAKKSSSSYNVLYNSYVKAIRWASDRIGEKGVIGFITDANFLNSNSTNGLRNCLYNEFNYLYIYNLQGSHRGTVKDQKREGTSVFGQGTMSSVAISILIKDDSNNHKIFYQNIGNYLSKDDKLNKIKNNISIKNIKWKNIIPDNNGDWINQSNPFYQKYWPLSSKSESAIFDNNAMGIQTGRDSWSYNFSMSQVIDNIKRLIKNYNTERKLFKYDGKHVLNTNSNYVKWSSKLKRYLKRNINIQYNNNIRLGMYRPFTKKWLYYDKDLVEKPGIYRTEFGKQNVVIHMTGKGSRNPFSALAIDAIPDLNLNSAGQGFMRYNNKSQNNTLFMQSNDNINKKFANELGLSNDNTFYYIYGILNSDEYKNKYQNDLRKDIARIPIVRNIKPFVNIGKKLMYLHLNYENIAPYKRVDIKYYKNNPSYLVNKMKHPSPQRKHRDVIEFNSDITIKNIPAKAYDYVINGKPAIEWIIQQYRIKKDKKSGIIDDPNKFSNNHKYVFNLLLSIINVSIKTVDLVKSLPKMEIIDKFDINK